MPLVGGNEFHFALVFGCRFLQMGALQPREALQRAARVLEGGALAGASPGRDQDDSKHERRDDERRDPAEQEDPAVALRGRLVRGRVAPLGRLHTRLRRVRDSVFAGHSGWRL